MIKPNWEIFRAKFSDNSQSYFEWFCYLLFCKEFDQPYGIFRYKNQSAIETNPIETGDKIIGWQAKFYDTPLSTHKDELLKCIEKSKIDYPNITVLLLYTNQEWGQFKGKKPQGLIAIEEQAKKLAIKLEWRTASYFESEFVSVNNLLYSKHFFSLERSIFDLINDQQKHTENILNQIQTHINFKIHDFEIDINRHIEKLKDKSQKILIVSGVGGVGKTVIVKKLYEELKDSVPFFVFKATEFELRNINQLFVNFSVYDFIKAYKDEQKKIIVIDSAEKLLDLNNTDPFKELLSALIKDEWKIIFTTRNNYLEDLNYQFFEIYKIAPLNISINNLELKELRAISDKYLFILPKEEKLLELIRNPFYLNEYLKLYKNKEEIKYTEFKNKLWDKRIKKSKPERERCFLKIALDRANSGQFFISPNCEPNTLDNELVRDGILGYELAGYFITHDIYEEWALEKIIEVEFIKKTSNQEFFKQIGESLAIRRSFRSWLSEKLLLNINDIKQFIEEVVESKEVKAFWKDEILISVLLSDYSDNFFEIFKIELLKNNQIFLKRLTFLLRIACKEVDEDFFKNLGVKDLNLFSLKYVLTKPKGQGWKSLIDFVFNNIEEIGVKNINFVLPVAHDWNSKVKEGSTTKLSSLIALQFYQWSIQDGIYFSRDDSKQSLYQTVIYGAAEIKEELKGIFEEVVKNKWKNHGNPYYELSNFILTKLEGISISYILPKNVLQLAELFWTYTPHEDSYYSGSRDEIEQYFDIEYDYLQYNPASSYQTPIYWLLNAEIKGTVDFILEFTNRSVESFSKSNFAKHEVEEIEIYLNKNTAENQYISNRLWCTYRGTQDSPHVLESMHMALEKYFIEIGKHADSKVLENWLFYLLENTNSASISAVVTSIALAYPEKTFNIAKILFQTKSFFLYDTNRLVLDLGYKSQLLMLKNNFSINHQNELHENERLKACDDKHRKMSLENLFLNYQCFRSEGTSDEDAEKRQQDLWEILDNYYQELPVQSEQSESEKTWRLFLARMDKRKMNITTEKTDDGIAIQFNPEIESDIKKHSEEGQAKYNEQMKYIPLKLWSESKFNNNDEYNKYDQYEKLPNLALKEVQDIVSKLSKINTPDYLEVRHSDEESFFLFNHSIPSYVCSVLMRDHIEELTEDEKSFCRDIVIEVASSSYRKNYQYQISDGVQAAISVLPILLEVFPEEKENIKTILLLSLFDDSHVGGMLSSERFSIFPIIAIQKLWSSHFNDAWSILLGYLLLRPKYDDLCERVRDENYQKGVYEHQDDQLIKRFLEENEEKLKSVIQNNLSLSSLVNLEKYDLSILGTAFRIIPQKTNSADHKTIAKEIISIFSDKLVLDDRENKINYQVKHDFLQTYAYFVLNMPLDEAQDFLKPFLDNFNTSEYIADLLQEFVLAEDSLNRYDNFWLAWNSFKKPIFAICKNGDGYSYIDKIIKSFLFAQVPWREDAKEWHTLKKNNKKFFKELSENIGNCPSTLYSLSKLLNDIGSHYIDDGMIWISTILAKNQDLADKKLEANTIYYIENLARKYTFKNRENIKKTKNIKDNLLLILDYLIEKGSVVGYMLRESIV